MNNINQTLGEFIIENQSDLNYSTGELTKLLNGIGLATKIVNDEEVEYICTPKQSLTEMAN